MSADHIKIWVDVAVGSLTLVAAPFAAYRGLEEWRRATEQRREELLLRQREFRHKQATFARELVKDIFDDKKARAALKMLDWLYEVYVDEDEQEHEIRRAEVQSALRVTQSVLQGNETLSEKDVFIRNCFEALYNYLEQLENLIDLQVVNFEDIGTVFRYYMTRALRPDVAHLSFLDFYDYPRAKKFLLRFAPASRDIGCDQSGR
jgi:hypothetical protein